jgi:ubiquitin carboxyl-terminal hydrolase L3
MADGEAAAGERWAALESNPEVSLSFPQPTYRPPQVLTNFCHLMGVSPEWEVVDVWGLDPDLLAFVPQPVLALVLLFPTRNSEGEKVRERLTVEDHPLAASAYYLRQTEGLTNACGTVAMVHAVLNNRGVLGLEGSKGALEQFYQATRGQGAEERGKALDASKEIGAVHNSLVAEGQSRQVAQDKVEHHFVCLTSVEGHLVELDGAYNSAPLVVGPLGEAGLLPAAAKHVQTKYLGASPDSIQFSLMALVMGQD